MCKFERDAQGNYVYKAQLSDKPFGEVKLMLSVAYGRSAQPCQKRCPAVQPKSMAVMLESLQARYNGRVLEAELETDARRRLYYSVELQQPNGSKLELEVGCSDAGSLCAKGGRLMRILVVEDDLELAAQLYWRRAGGCAGFAVVDEEHDGEAASVAGIVEVYSAAALA